MIDIDRETLLTINEAVEYLARRGLTVARSTVYDWHRYERQRPGTGLETVEAGGKICTSQEALQRYFTRRRQPGGLTGEARRRNEEAGRQLERMGS